MLTDEQIADLSYQVDDAADDIYQVFATRKAEYDAKYTAALVVLSDEQAALSTEPPPILAVYCQLMNLTVIEAAELIKLKHDEAMDALPVISNLRMQKIKLSGFDDLSAAQAFADGICQALDQIRVQL